MVCILQNVLPLLSELLHALDMQNALESLTDQGDYCKVANDIVYLGRLLQVCVRISKIICF